MTLRIIQFSDTHFSKETISSDKLNPQKSVEELIKLANINTPDPQIILVTGDLSHDGSPESYRRLANTLSKLQTPIYWLPGNHDNLVNIKDHFKGNRIFDNNVIIHQHWQIVLLNSVVSGEHAGFLKDEELDHLESCLSANPFHHTMVALHHHPIPMNREEIDLMALRNSEDLLRIIDHHEQVKIVTFGHVHENFYTKHNNVLYLGAPASGAYNYPKKMPGYRWIEVTQDGHATTGIFQLPDIQS